MTSRFTLNGKDAFKTWGAYLADGSMSALLTPAPIKTPISNKSRLEHGKRLILDKSHIRVDEREVTLTIYFRAKSEAEFMSRYESLVEEIQGGKVNISTANQPGVVYKFCYVSCTTFGQYNGTLGKCALRLNEPNPKDRTE